MDPLERLVAAAEIERLNVRYRRTVDTEALVEFAALFTRDAAMDMTESMSARAGGR